MQGSPPTHPDSSSESHSPLSDLGCSWYDVLNGPFELRARPRVSRLLIGAIND